MKKTLRNKLISLLIILFFNLPYFIFLNFIFEDVFKFGKTSSLVLAFLFYFELSANGQKHDELEERIEKLEKSIYDKNL